MLRINGQEAEDGLFCEAYARIEEKRGETLLTWFEFQTLAIFDILSRQPLDLWILEVGLGGRLDAVNMLDADVAIVTSIALDHMDRLGDTREAIGREKAGIFRAGKAALCGDLDPPASLQSEAERIGALLYLQGKDFSWSFQQASSQGERATETWSWQGKDKHYLQLPPSTLAYQNISSALMAIELLQTKLPVSEEALRQGIKTLSLAGRIEIIPGAITEILDVAHNPAATLFLAERLKQLPCRGKTRAVFSMLGDKDIEASIRSLKEQVSEWYLGPLRVKRAASIEKLTAAFEQEGIKNFHLAASIEESYQQAKKVSEAGDRLLILGSFHTVAAIKKLNESV
jgi:dihydrofolate synthase/folylpolyglutamate synthase